MVASGSQCSRCAASLPQEIAPGSLCGRCLRSPPDFDSVFAPYRYAPPLDRLVIDLKYNDALHLARALARLLATAAGEANRPRPDLFIPVPLHRRRLRERGYNQSLEIARFLGRSMGIPIAARAAMRVRDTEPQATLREGRRAQNVRHAFRADWPLAGMRIAIVDDVMTTGHTVDALARALRRQGAPFIDVWLAARA
jgi:ComF family protein